MYASKLYELLKSKAYGYSSTDTHSYTIRLAELEFIIGAADAQDTKVISFLSKSKNPDYEKALQIADKDKKKNTVWGEFKRNILDPSIEEIHKYTSMRVSYDVERKNLGGQVYAIIFSIRSNEKSGTVKPVNEVYEFITQLLGEDITFSEMKQIATLSDCDTQKIEEAYSIVQKENCNIAAEVIACLSKEPVVIESKGITPEDLDDLLKEAEEPKGE